MRRCPIEENNGTSCEGDVENGLYTPTLGSFDISDAEEDDHNSRRSAPSTLVVNESSQDAPEADFSGATVPNTATETVR